MTIEEPKRDHEVLGQKTLPITGFLYDRNDPNILYKLGLQALLCGNTEDAAQFMERAAELSPDNTAIRNSLGNLYLSLREWDKAESHLKTGLSIDNGHKELLSNMGLVCKVRKKFEEASDYFHKALTIDPNFLHARENLDFLYKDIVPSWHFSMMNDSLRNQAYDRAIRKAVNKDTVVLEIGTGAGLLAMMAVRAGAKHVYTTEMMPMIAETAREVVKHNGYDRQITVIAKNSKNLEIGRDLPEKADLLITETFDAGFLGEDAVPSIAHARQFLLKPNAAILPKGGTVYGCLLESQKLWKECAVETAAGFDLTPFNKFQENISGKYVQNFPYRRLSSDFEIFRFDFTGDPIQPDYKELEVDVTNSGTLHMLIYWFQLQLDDEVVIDTNIEDESCWRIAIQILNPPVGVEKNQKKIIIAQHDRSWMKLRLK